MPVPQRKYDFGLGPGCFQYLQVYFQNAFKDSKSRKEKKKRKKEKKKPSDIGYHLNEKTFKNLSYFFSFLQLEVNKNRL